MKRGVIRGAEDVRRDRAYATQRDRLIPAAEAYAELVAGPRHEAVDHSVWAEQWNKAFLTKMDELAREKGLI